MTTSFPTGLDTFTNPSATDPLNSPSHSAQHANKNDAIEALEAKVGIDSSAVETSHDKILADLKAVNFLVGTATGELSAEIAVGTTPGGELGNTWASPTVDATHSGTAHTDFVAKSLVDAVGDLIVGSAADTVARLPKGSDGQVLTVDAAETLDLKWATPSAGSGDVATDVIWAAKGDLAVGTGSDTAAILTAGTNDHVLTAASGEATGLKWAAGGAAASTDFIDPSGAASTPMPYGLKAWWVADDLLETGSQYGLVDTNTVGVWPDRMGASDGGRVDFFEATNLPTLQTAEINGHAVVRFDGTNDQMECPDRPWQSAPNMDYTIFIVAEKVDASVADHLAGKAGAAYEWQLTALTDGTLSFSTYQTAGAGHGTATTASTISSNTPFIATIRLDYLIKQEVWINGGVGGEDTSFTGTISDTSSTFTLGDRGDANNFWAGDIAEVMWFTRALTYEEIDYVLGTYLDAKYGITVSGVS